MRVHSMLFVALFTLAGGGAFAQSNNVIVNGDFETNPPASLGNNIGYSIAPWVLGSGQSSNVVTVDGPGGYDYGNNGPESDASAPGAGVLQHYLDIANGSNDFYQSFTPQCGGEVEFGGFFSTRADARGTATVVIRDGVGTTGAVVGATNNVVIPGGTSKTDPWTEVHANANVTAGSTYSFVVSMDNNMNFDNGYVRFKTNCNPPPVLDPCCPPWNPTLLEQQMFYVGSGSISADYTLSFQPTTVFAGQMQSYIDYLSSVNPAFQAITIQFRLHDGGTGATPAIGAQIGASRFATWNANTTNGPVPTPNYFTLANEPMHINQWYVVHTGIFLENGQTFFPSSCGNNEIAVRLQVITLSTGGGIRPVLQFRDSAGRITEKLVSSVR
jgi:hypothetical protein